MDRTLNLQILLLPVRVNLGVMSMKEYSKPPRSPELEPHHQTKGTSFLEDSYSSADNIVRVFWASHLPTDRGKNFQIWYPNSWDQCKDFNQSQTNKLPILLREIETQVVKI